MLLEKKQQARDLYFQSELTKTQISTLLNVSRRSVSNWIKDGEWERLRRSAEHLPAIIAENCYHIMGHLTEHHLSEYRLTNPISPKEIDGLYKLSLTINKVKNRSTLNESMEMFGFFMEGLKARDGKLAEAVMPYIDEYVGSRAGIYAGHVAPDHFSAIGGRIPWYHKEKDPIEAQLDKLEMDEDIKAAMADYGVPIPTPEELGIRLDDAPTPPLAESESPAPAAIPAANVAQPLPVADTCHPEPLPGAAVMREERPTPEEAKKYIRRLSTEDRMLYDHYCRMAMERKEEPMLQPA